MARIWNCLMLGLLLGAFLSAGDAKAQPTDVTGTWFGDLMIDGNSRRVILQLHQRDAGEVMGYIVGGTAQRTVIAGQVSGATLSVELELVDPLATRVFAVGATIDRATLVGSVDDGTGPQSVTWTRVRGPLHERRFLFAKPTGGDPTGLADLAVVVDRHGAFVGGAFVGVQDCDVFACAGAVTSFSETGDTIAIGLATDGACSATGSLTATFDGTTKFYSGSYATTGCGASSGPLIGVKTTRTRTDHVKQVLATFGRLADDLEAEIAFSAPYRPISPDYSHLGETRADRLAELNAQVADYDGIEVELSRFRDVYTVAEPDIFPDLDRPLGVDFRDRRSGIPAGGGATVLFRDADTQSGADELKYLVRKGSKWIIYGNQIIHDIPFAGYTLAADHVVLPTSGGDVYMAIGPWGAHVVPHTGHVEGNAKADWLGQYAWTLDQLTELAGDSDGLCESGETCGLHVDELDARSLDYVAPTDEFQIIGVELERLDPPGFYFGTDEHWRVRGKIGPYSFDFLHLRGISQDLRDAMLLAGFTDPWTVHAPSTNLITGAPVVLSKGETIARPQIFVVGVPGFPDYYKGDGPVRESPWQQIEFFVHNQETVSAESFYTWLPAALEAQLAGILEASGLNPNAFRYNNAAFAQSRWKAEMALSNAVRMSHEDYSSLFSALGGWWENDGAGCVVAALCDELFSIYPIAKGTVFYDPALYHTPDVSYLTIRRIGGIHRFGDVLTPAVPDLISGSMVIRWENFDESFYGFQGVSYHLSPADRTLRLAWGTVVADEMLVALPPVPLATDVCDGTGLTCHNHDRP